MRSCGRPREGSRLARRRLPGPPRPPPLPACGATRCRPRPGPRRANSGRPPGRRDRGRPGRLLPSAPECSQPFCLRARERAAGSIGNRISYAVCALDRILRTVSTDTEARRPSEAIAERCSLQTNVALDTASEPAHLLRRLRGRRGRFLKARGVDRIFALCGGHIMPLWMRADAEGIRIVDVRDERAAVHMAQAHAELTGGLGVALVTAGPGVTNAMTGIANAHVSRAPGPVLPGVV